MYFAGFRPGTPQDLINALDKQVEQAEKVIAVLAGIVLLLLVWIAVLLF